MSGEICNLIEQGGQIAAQNGYATAAQLVQLVADACRRGDWAQVAKMRGCGCGGGGGGCKGCRSTGSECCACVGDGVGVNNTATSIARLFQAQPTAMTNAAGMLAASMVASGRLGGALQQASAAYPVPGAAGAGPVCPNPNIPNDCWQNLNAWQYDYRIAESVARGLIAGRCQEPFRFTEANFVVQHPTHPEYLLAALEAYPKVSCWRIKLANLTLGNDTVIDTVAAWTVNQVIDTDTKELIPAILPSAAALAVIQVTDGRCNCDELLVCVPAGMPAILGFVASPEDVFSGTIQVQHCDCDPGYFFCGPYVEIGDPWVRLPDGITVIPTAAPI